VITLSLQDYRSKVLGCWMGKNIGGTLGAPFEWRRKVNDVSFYTQDLGGEPLPNDDLDIQLLWLVALEEQGIDLDAHTLADYWCLYVTPHWAEYGTAKNNMRSGLLPPLSGTLNNVYKDSCGAFIRSEIWACIAPACPQVAAWYAYQDAILDHGNGEGTFAEVFCAALESAAFVLNDLRALIDIGLSYIPQECAVAGAARAAIASYESGRSWQEARDAMLEDYRGSTHAGVPELTSPTDREKGFHTGPRGWDVPSNIGMLVTGLLYGEGEFDRTLCTAVNCGEDTDCTAATAGAIFGLMHGIEAIPERWIAPIGRRIKTACLNLGELGYFGAQLPQDVDEMTRRTEEIAQQVLAARNLPVRLVDDAVPGARPSSEEGSSEAVAGALVARDPYARTLDTLLAKPFAPPEFDNLGGTIHRFDFFEVAVDYGGDPLVRDGQPKPVTLCIRNLYKVQDYVNIHWYAPPGWSVSPAPDGKLFVPCGWLALGASAAVTFELSTERIEAPVTRFAVELTITGRPTVMLVPVMLVNGNLV